MSILPTNVVKATQKSPRRLVIFSAPKIGKTTLLAQLPNSLLVDLEDGSEFVDAMRINVHKEAKKAGKPVLSFLKDIHAELKEDKVKYDYIILDTATALEELAKELGLILYKKSPIGKNFMDTDILTLPNGAGYLWLRNAFDEIYKLFDPYAKKCLILSAHIKKSSITKQGKELSARDLDLTGKLKQIVTSGADAIGYLYRNKETNQNILSFQSSEQDLATGARPEHLRGKEFIISELKDGKLITNWNEIFID